MSYQQVRDLPVRTFWHLSKEIDRIRADEIVEWLPAHASAMGGEGIQKLFDRLRERIGSPAVVEQKGIEERDLRRLGELFG